MVVSDLQQAIDFYGRLGLEFPADPDPEAHGHVEAELPEGLRAARLSLLRLRPTTWP
ncbi:MAG: hypothetical protein ACRDNG_14940 [Gaiellaceae bacterium]